MEILNTQQWQERLSQNWQQTPSRTRALASTWWQGIVVDPALMVVPIEDHQVHRGDALFEALKFIHGRVYLEAAHVERLFASAASVEMKVPLSREEISIWIRKTIQASGLSSGLVRLFVTRGVGGFSTNPYDCPRAHFYVAVTDLLSPSPKLIEQGAKVAWSKWPAKDPIFARIKSCNYLLNVMMKKESVDRGVDFVITLTPGGEITESSTENIFLVDSAGDLVCPSLEVILKGTTMTRACELAQSKLGLRVVHRRLQKEDLFQAKELMMAGTTLDVISVVELEGKPIGITPGQPGPIAQRLRELIQKDQLSE